MTTWRHTDKWRPAQTGTASGCFAVESVDSGRLGLFKPKDIPQEKLCADLAQAVGVNVPEVQIGTLDGSGGTGAVSFAHGKESVDLQYLKQHNPALYESPKMKAALRSASGLLAFHAWVRTGDLKDAHLVVAGNDAEGYTVTAIDFAASLGLGGGSFPADNVQRPQGLQSLVENRDEAVIRTAVERIENCPDATIEDLVNGLADAVLPRPEKDRIIAALKARREHIGDAMKQGGWMT